MRGFGSEFEREFKAFLMQQQRGAKGQRLEMLKKDMTGTKKLLEVAVWPVLKSFEGLVLEYEMVSQSGIRIYVDVFYRPLLMVMESMGFAVHAQNITRERFDFEQMRIQTFASLGYRYVPFSWDQLDKKPEACQRFMYEMLGRYGSRKGSGFWDLHVYERELLRYMLLLNRPLHPKDARDCLGIGQDACRRVLRSLLDRKLIYPAGTSTLRHHEYQLEQKAFDYMM